MEGGSRSARGRRVKVGAGHRYGGLRRITESTVLSGSASGVLERPGAPASVSVASAVSCVRACVRGVLVLVAGSTWIYMFRLLLLVSATNPSFFVEAMCGFFLCCEGYCSAPPRIDENTSMQSLHRKLLKHWSVSATSSEASQPYSHNSAGQIGGGEAAVLEASGRKRCVSRVVCGTRLPCLGSCLFRCKIVIYNIQLYNMYGRGLSG